MTPDVVLAARSDAPPVKSSASQLQAHVQAFLILLLFPPALCQGP